MDDVARLSPQDRSDLFKAAAERLEVTAALIEKDFWVCWVIRRLYGLPDLPARIYFKGGTSLSKVFHVIERMSEDIDLVIDRRGLGFAGDKDPAAYGISSKARKRLVNELKSASRRYVRDRLTPLLESAFTEALGAASNPPLWAISLENEDDDDQTLLFEYPTIEPPSAYIRPTVRLELGARGDPRPSVSGTVRPYAAEVFPDQFQEPDTKVPFVVSAQRTFWEKATLLHMLHHQRPDKQLTPRMARHYYDLFRLASHDLGRKALTDTDLLRRVVDHKLLFFRSSRARYELAKAGSLRLLPPDERLSDLRADFDEMAQEMMFGDVPEFDSIITRLNEIEEKVNTRMNA